MCDEQDKKWSAEAAREAFMIITTIAYERVTGNTEGEACIEVELRPEEALARIAAWAAIEGYASSITSTLSEAFDELWKLIPKWIDGKAENA